MARRKKINKASIERLLMKVIDGYNDVDDNGLPIDKRVKTTDYLKAVSMIAIMNGIDKPATDTNQEDELEFVV